MTTRIFQIALVSKIDEKQAPWFNYQTKNIITYTLWEHLVPIAIAAGGFIPGPSWSLSAAQRDHRCRLSAPWTTPSLTGTCSIRRRT